jgi:hypothetical protein
MLQCSITDRRIETRMQREIRLAAVMLAIAGCGGADAPEQPADAQIASPSVLEPSPGALDRANSVQQTVDDEAAELRRRIEEAER